jgi:Transposase DDE domain group 1
MLIFERHTGCLLAARLRPGNASSHARIVPMLLRLVPRLQAAFPSVKIKLRGDAGFALPLLYKFCEFFGIQYAIGIPANSVFQQRAEPRQRQLKRRYRRTQVPQRSFSSFRHRARSWSHLRRICYKAEHSAAGTNLRFVVTNCTGRASQVFAFYNDRGECENRIEVFKNGFHAHRLSCHRFLANAFRLLLHGAAYNLVNLFRHHLPLPWRSGPDRNLAGPALQNRCPCTPNRPLRPHSPGHRLALSEFVPLCRTRRQQRLTRFLLPNLAFMSSSRRALRKNHLSPLSRCSFVREPPLCEHGSVDDR